ncbi:glycoside hydrolase superfamily [Trichoderma sp. SZMC 28014]
MKFLKSKALALLAATSVLASPLQSVSPRASSYATVSGLQFTIDGETGYFAGTNCYWCSFLTNPADVDLTFGHMASSGLKIVRIWGFNDVNQQPGTGTIWFQLLSASGSTINTGSTGLGNLDYVVQSAETHGLKLIINFVNNWSDYGGINAYVNAFGGNATSWYTNTAAQAQYRTYIQAVVSRYANSTAIFAWELANEPRCNGCATSVVWNWASSVSQYVKSLDSNHLVTLGDEGLGLATGSDGSYPYTYGEGTDFASFMNITTLDFSTFHLYPNSWGETYDWGSSWVETHAQACVAAGQPCMLEEYGAPTNHCAIESPWQQTSLASKGMAADLLWQWGDTLSTGQSSDDGNTVYYGTSDFTCLVTDHVAAIDGGTPPPPASSTTTSKATSTSKPPSGPTGSCSSLYGQCGGTGWSGATCCSSGTCTYSNPYYSQCVPS